MKKMMKVRDEVRHLQKWKTMLTSRRFHLKAIYLSLIEENQSVFWRSVMYGNMARPKICILYGMACHSKLATKERLM